MGLYRLFDYLVKGLERISICQMHFLLQCQSIDGRKLLVSNLLLTWLCVQAMEMMHELMATQVELIMNVKGSSFLIHIRQLQSV